MSFPAYPEYKDSGVEWLGEVPAHWALTKFSRQFAVRMGETIPEIELLEDGLLPVYSATEKDKYYGYVNERSPLLKEGDLVIPARGNSIGHVKLARGKSTSTQTTIVANNINPKITSGSFAYYWSVGLREVLFHFDQTAIPQITTEYVARNRFLMPPLPEQQVIATFLDHETARIDALIAEQQRLIALLKEKRQAVISHAVTKGLDPDATMKDSGVEWLGDVPGHWELLPLKYMVSEPLKYGANEAASDDNSNHPRFVRITDITASGTLRDNTFRSLPPEVARQYILEEGDILFARSGATVGKSFLYKKSWGECCFAGYLIRARIDCQKAIPSFIYFSFQSHGYWQYISQQQIKATIQNVSAERYESYTLLVPPIDEQVCIVKYLNRCLDNHSQLFRSAEQSVSLLQERRSALISAAVTGKIDVRGWQAEEQIDPEDTLMAAEPQATYL